MAVRLECAVKHYHWGKVGDDSLVARFARNNQEEFSIDDNQTYAELWMGTLASGPSVVKPDNIPLAEYIGKSSNSLGENITSKFKDQLPFLFKVLSVNQSLSIQAHPNKKHAEELNKRFPEIYQDDNHKPEMALALTDFEGMCGFRPLHEIQSFLKGVPELSAVIGESASEGLANVTADDAEAVKSAIKQAFSNLMRCDSSLVAQKVLELVNRLSLLDDDASIDDGLSELIQRLNTQFPCDVGIFAVFFLNIMKLKPGEAMYLAANIPHAYLYGDCVECMATSDNVVRAGLTPKLKDVDTLVEMLDYTPKTSQENLMEPKAKDDDSHVRVFEPDVPDFGLHEVKIPKDQKYSLSKENSASLLIVTEGQGSSDVGQVKHGHVFFVPATESFTITPESDSLTMYRALCLP